jgi:hypothetical protein
MLFQPAARCLPFHAGWGGCGGRVGPGRMVERAAGRCGVFAVASVVAAIAYVSWAAVTAGLFCVRRPRRPILTALDASWARPSRRSPRHPDDSSDSSIARDRRPGSPARPACLGAGKQPQVRLVEAWNNRKGDGESPAGTPACRRALPGGENVQTRAGVGCELPCAKTRARATANH